MGCSESKGLENIDQADSSRCIFTLVKPREQTPEEKKEENLAGDGEENPFVSRSSGIIANYWFQY
jgi:hypothetical protein